MSAIIENAELVQEEPVKPGYKPPSLEQLLENPESIVMETAPYDPRFPNTNQTKNCWQNYVDFHRCVAAKGEDYQPCQVFRRRYKILCPQSWVSYLANVNLLLQVERWDEAIQSGTYPSDVSAPDAATLRRWTRLEKIA